MHYNVKLVIVCQVPLSITLLSKVCGIFLGFGYLLCQVGMQYKLL